MIFCVVSQTFPDFGRRFEVNELRSFDCTSRVCRCEVGYFSQVIYKLEINFFFR